MSTPWVSYHSRALLEPTSALFWWSAETSSILNFGLALGLEVLDRHLSAEHRTLAAQVGIHAGHVGQHGDLDHVAGDLAGLRQRGTGRRQQQQRKATGPAVCVSSWCLLLG
jgi:hypothetical protein